MEGTTLRKVEIKRFGNRWVIIIDDRIIFIADLY